jgi:DNA mismatch endonuclease, patch repair protein
MSAIKSKNTKPELSVRTILHKMGFRYRLHDKRLPGKPDLVFRKYNTALFVHGCFWHGHQGCKDFRIPKTRPEWWRAKIAANIQRDHRNSFMLNSMGWNVQTIWECEICPENIEMLATKIKKSV